MILELGIFIGGAATSFAAIKFLNKGNDNSNLSNKIDNLSSIIKGDSHSPLLLDTGDKHANTVANLVGTPMFINPSNDFEIKFNKLLFTIQNSMQEEKRIIGEITLSLGRISRGELNVDIPSSSKNPMYSGLIHEVSDTKKTLLSIIQIIEKGVNEIQNNNYQNDYVFDGILLNELKNVLNSMSNLSKNLSDSAIQNIEINTTKSSTFNSMNDNISVLSSNANRQAASLEETSAAVEEISGNLNNTANKNQLMLKEANIGLQTSQEGLNKLEITSKIVEEINDYQTKIEEATKVIDQIAFQTNILSLNAAVEAATAGEHGKGFAVVAQEVRNLAAKSADAANEIKDLVQGSISKAKEGTSQTSETLTSFNNVVNSIESTRNLVQEVSSASEETVIGIKQINNTVQELDSFTQDNANLANSVKDMSSQLIEITKEEMREAKSKKVRK